MEMFYLKKYITQKNKVLFKENYKICFLLINLNLMPIPFQLLQAFLLSQLVLLATDG